MRILLTGGLGNVGNNVLEVLVENGNEVTVFELRTATTTARNDKLKKKLTYSIVWGDVTNEEDVKGAIAESDPEAIIHLAAIIPPGAYLKPTLAEAVNVGGTKTVVNCANAMQVPPRFVFSSSYSICGSYNAEKDVVFQTAETPANAKDLYGRQKQTCEKLIKDTYEGPWVILRFCRLIEPNINAKAPPGSTLFLFSLPENQRCHGGHPKDIGRACLSACKVEEAVGRILPIGGDDSWRLTVGDMTDDLFNAVGIVGMSRDVYRQGHPEVDESWYFETWIDTEESERILQYQKVTYQDFMKEVARNTWIKRLFIRPFSRIAASKLQQQSPFYKVNKERRQTQSPISEKTIWEVIRDLFPTAPESYEVPPS